MAIISMGKSLRGLAPQALLGVAALVGSWFGPTVTFARSDGSLDGANNCAHAKADQAFYSRPLTVECRARFRDKRSYNIVLACEPKSSPAHWELYTHVGSGHLALWVPGNETKDVRSNLDLVDGAWHDLAAVMDGREIRLYGDGVEIAKAPDTRPNPLQGQEGHLAIGALVEGGIGCSGVIDDIRISRVVRTIDKSRSHPLSLDDATLALWRLDEPASAQQFADATGNHPAARKPPNSAGVLGGGIAGLSGSRASEFVRPKDGQVGVISPPCDLGAVRSRLTEALADLKLETITDAARIRDGLLVDWDEQGWHLANRVSGREKLPDGADRQVYDRQALVFPEDGDALGVVLRRTGALLASLKQSSPAIDRAAESRDLATLQRWARQTPVSEPSRRQGAFLAACALNRHIALKNPLLDFDRILFVARGVYQGSRKGGLHGTADSWGQHFATQYYGFNAIPGGGLFVVADFQTSPRIVNLTAGVPVQDGRFRRQKLEGGSFLAPDLSYDGKTILFSWAPGKGERYDWGPDNTWKIFRIQADGSDLHQLTDGAWDDFDACWLPSGRIAFLSERRGGYVRCFGGLPVPQHSLHSMKADGSDIFPISYFETSEWHPSVNNDGMLVYTRWDYVDRENCLGSNIWTCYPDGRNPRAPHGNYPYPWHTFPPEVRPDSRRGRPFTEMNIRAIPGSPLYVLTAAPHHGESFGSLCLLDLRQPDDGFMSQLRRITPYVRFPESEMGARLQYQYGTAWPLSEDFYLCNAWENLYLLDRFGNQVLLLENSLVFGGATDWDMRLIDPIPLRPRPMPPVIPSGTNQGEDARPDADVARITLANVYLSDQPFPPGTRIKYLRVLQNVPKTNSEMNLPRDMGYHWENTPRIPLGTVPVHEDGSAHFLAPVERELIFQALDENHMAVQTMRSVTYVHRGEHLTCVGCHEPQHQTVVQPSAPLQALRCPPARLEPEAGPVEPVTYYRLVKPVFEKSCVPCHREKQAGPTDMSFEGLRPYVFYFAGGMSGNLMEPVHGGSRSIPGYVGARNSRLGQALLDANHRGQVAPDDFRRIVVWLDANAMRLGAFEDEERQVAGELVWPAIDCDPKNPQGLERPAGNEPVRSPLNPGEASP